MRDREILDEIDRAVRAYERAGLIDVPTKAVTELLALRNSRRERLEIAAAIGAILFIVGATYLGVFL